MFNLKEVSHEKICLKGVDETPPNEKRAALATLSWRIETTP